MSTLDEANRREYYRIEDVIALEITPLSAAEFDNGKVLQDASPLFNLLSELHLSEFESQHLLRQISERDRTLSSYLKTLNKRVDLLSQIVAQTVLGKVGELQPVTLSEGGIDFHHPQAYPVDSHVSVKLVLMPQALGLLLRARIVECRADAGRYWIATEFEALSETQRQLLARHILQKQAQARRLARDLDDPTTE